MNQSFKVDGNFGGIALYAAKLVVPALLISGANAALGHSARASWIILVAGIVLTAVAVVGRTSWGDQLSLAEDSLVVSKGAMERLRIPLKSITAVRSKTDVVAIAWRETDRRRSLVIGKERFSDETWAHLSAMVASLSVHPSAAS